MRFRLTTRVLALASAAALPAAAQTAPAPQAAPPAATGATAGTAAAPAAGFVAPSPANAVEQIVVTANKRRQLQRDVANSVTALSGRDLDRKQEVTLQDIASQVPGLSLETDDKTAVRVVLRGLNTGSAGATVASLLDDVATNPTGAINNAAINTPNFDTYDLQRIEVLRGPQSTLYGATAEGGLVKYVTNAPDPSAFSGGLESSLDGAPVGNIGGSLKGFVNIPLPGDKAALRLTGWNEWTPGYVDNPLQGKTDTNSAQQYGWRASLLLDEPVPDLTLRLTAERQTLLSNNLDSVLVNGAPDPAAPPQNQLGLVHGGLSDPTALSQPSQNEAAVYYANIGYDLGWASLTSITGFSYAKFHSVSDATNQNVVPAGPGTPAVTLAEDLAGVYGVPLAADERQDSNTDKFSEEVRLASEPGQTLYGHEVSWLIGGYDTHETSSLLQYIDVRDTGDLKSVLTAPAVPGGLGLVGALSEWAVFGQADLHLIPTFDVELGGRWSGNDQHSSSQFACCLLYGPAFNGGEISSNDHDALYSVAPRWQPNADTMFYGRIATGYRPGGPNLPVPGVPGLPETYGPDHTVNYEIGWRQDLFHKSVSLDVTGYYISWKDVQILSLVNTPVGPVGVNGNAGAAVSKGVEWSLTWVPLPGLSLSATGAYTDARLTVNAPGLGGASGDVLPYVPDVTSNLTAEYAWAPADGYRQFVSATWTHTGTRYTSFAPAQQVAESHVALPGYDTGAFRTGLEHGRYSVEFYVTNIADSRAITYYANEGGANGTGLATLVTPRIFGLVTRLRF